MTIRHKISIRLTTAFFIVYTVACTFGSIFLVTWGSTNWYKELMIIMLTWPIGWDKLIVDSLIWLMVNIAFWTALIYVASLTIETLVRHYVSSHPLLKTKKGGC